MKRNVKILITVLLLALALAMVSACNRNGEDEYEPTAEPEVEDVVEDYEEEDEDEPYEYEEDEEEEEEEYVPAPVVVALPEPPGYVWSLSRDPAIQGQNIGTLGGDEVIGDTPFIIAAGSPVFSIEPGPFGNALQLQFRSENWFALDLYTNAFGFNFDANAYQLTVRGRVADPDGTTVIIGGADSPWNWLFNTTPDDDGAFAISGIISYETMNATDGGMDQFARCFRIQTNNLTDFVVYEILITQVPRNHVWSLAHDFGVHAQPVGAIGGNEILEHTPFLTAAGSPVFSIEQSPLGGNAVALQFRSENWFALDMYTEAFGFNFEENTYHITLTGSVADPEGTQVIIGGADGPWNWLLNTEPEADGSFTIEGYLSMETMMATDGGYEQFMRCFRIQTNNITDFVVYGITIVRAE